MKKMEEEEVCEEKQIAFWMMKTILEVKKQEVGVLESHIKRMEEDKEPL